MGAGNRGFVRDDEASKRDKEKRDKKRDEAWKKWKGVSEVEPGVIRVRFPDMTVYGRKGKRRPKMKPRKDRTGENDEIYVDDRCVRLVERELGQELLAKKGPGKKPEKEPKLSDVGSPETEQRTNQGKEAGKQGTTLISYDVRLKSVEEAEYLSGVLRGYEFDASEAPSLGKILDGSLRYDAERDSWVSTEELVPVDDDVFQAVLEAVQDAVGHLIDLEFIEFIVSGLTLVPVRLDKLPQELPEGMELIVQAPPDDDKDVAANWERVLERLAGSYERSLHHQELDLRDGISDDADEFELREYSWKWLKKKRGLVTRKYGPRRGPKPESVKNKDVPETEMSQKLAELFSAWPKFEITVRQEREAEKVSLTVPSNDRKYDFGRITFSMRRFVRPGELKALRKLVRKKVDEINAEPLCKKSENGNTDELDGVARDAGGVFAEYGDKELFYHHPLPGEPGSTDEYDVVAENAGFALVSVRGFPERAVYRERENNIAFREFLSFEKFDGCFEPFSMAVQTVREITEGKILNRLPRTGSAPEWLMNAVIRRLRKDERLKVPLRLGDEDGDAGEILGPDGFVDVFHRTPRYRDL